LQDWKRILVDLGIFQASVRERSLKFSRLNAPIPARPKRNGKMSRVLDGGAASTVVVACAELGVVSTFPAMSVARE
jgi:hypothetical protein